MRGLGRRIVVSTSPKCVKEGVVSNYSTFSNGRGRGRGSGSGNDDSDFPKPDFVSQTPVPNPYGTIGRGQPINNETNAGMGRGRGKPISSSSSSTSTSTNLPSFSSWVSGINPSIGRGQPQQETQSGQSKKPIFFQREEGLEGNKDAPQFSRDNVGPIGMFNGLTSGGAGGAGRGKVFKHKESEEKKGEEEVVVNRHVGKSTPWKKGVSAKNQGVGLNKEEATKKAMDILAAGVNKAKEGGSVGRGGFSTRGRGGRGKGRGNFRGRGGGRFGQRGEDQQDEDEDEDEFSVGDNAAGERLAQELGPELTAKLDRVIDDYVEVILPDPEEDAFDEAEDYNMKIECEPEYMVEFDNPDIDEKPPMPLRDVLEKVKPFMMAYEGIKDQAEWEEVVEEVMSTVPHMKQVVDQYCGPDRVTAKQQQQELERVAKTLPDNVPSSVKRYTDRAVLSLQSNPGWGWDKKCQFMDKLVWEVSQQYK